MFMQPRAKYIGNITSSPALNPLSAPTIYGSSGKCVPTGGNGRSTGSKKDGGGR